MLQTHAWLPRSEGSLRLAFPTARKRPRLWTSCIRPACWRARFPKPETHDSPEAVLVNTAGGLTGGDRLDIERRPRRGDLPDRHLGGCREDLPGARGRSRHSRPHRPGASARLAWLPQPTILFDAARFDRRTEVDLAANATFLAVETLIFGRAAMGEDVHRGFCRDVWRVRRDGKLAFADSLQLDGAIAATLDRPAALDGARATAFVLYCGRDAAARLEPARALLEGAGSTIRREHLERPAGCARLRSRDGRTLQRDLVPLLEFLADHALPRVWRC